MGELDLAELAKASRVSPRTIRYYIHQGLLPSPGKRGRGARYDRGLLDRLELIKQLQRDGWPLGRIAELLPPSSSPLPPPSSLLPPPSSLLPVRSTWDHVRVTPDVDISVRRPLSAEQKKRVDRLIQAARQMFRDK